MDDAQRVRLLEGLERIAVVLEVGLASIAEEIQRAGLEFESPADEAFDHPGHQWERSGSDPRVFKCVHCGVTTGAEVIDDKN